MCPNCGNIWNSASSWVNTATAITAVAWGGGYLAATYGATAAVAAARTFAYGQEAVEEAILNPEVWQNVEDFVESFIPDGGPIAAT